MHGLGGVQDDDVRPEGISVHYIRIYRSEQVMHALEKGSGKVRTTVFAPLRVRQPRVPAGHIQCISENG
jgi:hypothetical protein